jgi:hypothetical protein
MTRERPRKLVPAMQRAVDELQETIRHRYADASFRIADDPEGAGINIWTSVELDDPEEVLDLVLERVLEFQVDEELPIHVIPIRAAKAAARARAALAREPHVASHLEAIAGL